jgi:hypothetical protein
VAAVVTRVVWVLWIHPPDEALFSDMAHYIARARQLADGMVSMGDRSLAWQTFGTHYLLALPLAMFGSQPPYAAANLLWGLTSAAAVPLCYLLAARVSAHRWMARAAGLVMLLWYPALSNAGFFLAETPALTLQLGATYFLVVLIRDGRRPLVAGIFGGLAFAVRPQVGIFLALACLAWLIQRRRFPMVTPKKVALVAAPVLVVVLFSAWRFAGHTGHWGGVAENANMNLTAGRCHNVVTQAFTRDSDKLQSDQRGDTSDGRRISLPGFRLLSELPDSHPFALRPALEHESIKLVGYIGDADVHRAIRKRCYAATGLTGQLRYTMVNVSLLWFFSHQWPEVSEAETSRTFFHGTVIYRGLYQWLVWLPSLIGMGWALRHTWRRDGDLAVGLLGLQILVSLGVAAVFFGTIRLRLPYDPYAIILALGVWGHLARRVRARKPSP